MKYKIKCIDSDNASISYICNTDMNDLKMSDGLIILDKSEHDKKIFRYVHVEKYITDKEAPNPFRVIRLGDVIHKLSKEEERLIWELERKKNIIQIKHHLRLQEENTALAEEIYEHIYEDINFNDRHGLDIVYIFNNIEETINWFIDQGLLNTEMLVDITFHVRQSTEEAICDYFNIKKLKNGNYLYIDK